MSSGGKSRSKSTKGGTDRSGGSGGGSTHQTKSDHNHNEKDKDVLHKIPPTVEQLRIAQMIDNTHSEKVLQEKINQVIQVTSVSTDDAIVALHDCDNDVNAAIDSLLEGEDQGEWRESTKKKKKAPAAKSKEEAESNKENRRVENRERSGSRPRGGGAGGPPRFRGRGGGRGGREETSEGVGRGSGGGRRGRMANGTGPPSRGRGGRGRGSSSSARTFQKRQPPIPGFTETIDTWGSPPETKVEDDSSNLQIDNWDEEQSTTTEEWDSEWTGSLDKTTVFSPSTSIGSGGLASQSPPQEHTQIISSGSSHTSTLGSSINSVLGGPQTNQVNNRSNTPPSAASLPPLSESVNVLSLAQTRLQSPPMSVPQSYSTMAPPTPNSISQAQTINLAALLSKAAPHSNLGRLPPTPLADGNSLVSSSLGVDGTKSIILSTMTPSVGDCLKSGMMSNSMSSSTIVSAVTASAASPPSYSPSSAAISNSMFSNSVPSMGSGSSKVVNLSSQNVSLSSQNVSLSSQNVSLSSQNVSLSSRSKPPRNRLPHSSKIPSKAVEMPEVAMAALDMKFTGLEFGTETFDFTSDVSKPLIGTSLVSSVNSRDPRDPRDHRGDPRDPRSDPRDPRNDPRDHRDPRVDHRDLRDPRVDHRDPRDLRGDHRDHRDPRADPREQQSSVPVSVSSKDLSSLATTMSQPQSLGPQPIPFPSSQSAERKPQTNLLSGTTRPSLPGPSAASVQNLADLKKDTNTATGGPSLGSLVGSGPTGHSQYQSSGPAGYGPPKPTSFPSPPAHYAQNSTQNYSGSTSTGVSNNTYAGTSVNSNTGVPSSNSNNNQTGGGYSSTFSASAAAASGQYQNNYVSVSSHSLASMGASKAHSGIKEASQNYNDTSGNSSSLSGSLATSAGGSNSGAGLSTALNSAPTSSVQPTKPSAPGKTVNTMGTSVPPGVQQLSVSQQQHQVGPQQLSQHHQSHHHLQQQQQVAQQTQQTQQLMAGPSQYVSPQQAALQGIPPPFYSVQQPAMYSFEDLQVFQQRIPHMPQNPTSIGGREAALTSPPSYSVAEASKYRTDQNSSPVPSTINQQDTYFPNGFIPCSSAKTGAAAGATYITAPGNAGLPPFYMYQTMPAVPSTFSQYGAPAIIQIPPNSHTGSTTTQFPGPPKIHYGGSSAFYDNMSQTQDYKPAYGSAAQGPTKAGPNVTGSASNATNDLSSYKNHLSKVNRTYDKQAFHTGTPPPFNLPGSGTNHMTANYPPMFIPTMPAAQHHSPLMHHQLHQDGGSSAGQRAATGGGQNKAGGKASYTNSFW